MGDPLFENGEAVLCFHGAQLYKAKILECAVRQLDGKDTNVYLVHYDGWKKKWDEWVPEVRVLKLTDENKARQKSLVELARSEKKRGAPAAKSSKRGAAAAKDAADSKQASKRRRTERTDDTYEAEDEFYAKLEVKMALPDELKHVLVEDWSKVTGEKMLPVLPAKVTVSDILDRFCKHGGPKGTAVTDTTREVAAGIKVYFQEALGTMLLYKFERPQYDELIKENSDLDPCDTYGGVHLLRLFVKMPKLLVHTQLGQKEMRYLQQRFADLFKFLVKNRELVAGKYEAASAEYLKRAK